MEKKRYIIGLGNYSRNDDGVGLRIIEHIVDHNLDNNFEAVEVGNDGLKALIYFEENTEMILFVDCAMINMKPGEFRIFSPDEVNTRKITANISTHEGDIMKLINLAKDIASPIPSIRIMAIQPESLGMDMKLSETLTAKMDEYVRAAIEEITQSE